MEGIVQTKPDKVTHNFTTKYENDSITMDTCVRKAEDAFGSNWRLVLQSFNLIYGMKKRFGYIIYVLIISLEKDASLIIGKNIMTKNLKHDRYIKGHNNNCMLFHRLVFM